MDFRSILDLPRSASIPLLPLHKSNAPISSDLSQRLGSTHKSPYHTAPQSPELHPSTFADHGFPLVKAPMTSVMASSSAARPTLPHSEAQITLRRQQKYLESQLQTLLDAQSEGLIAGLTGAGDEHTPSPRSDRSSSTAGRSTSRSTTTGTGTPAYDSRSSHITWAPPGGESGRAGRVAESGQVMPVRQPKPKRIGLRSARRGISRTMAELAVLKTQESEALAVESDRRAEALSAVNRTLEKEAGLRAQIQKIEDESMSEQRLQGMKVEEASLDADIKEVEGRLYEMKARQRVLKLEISGVENRAQAKLSSYRNALGLAEKEAKGLLARPLLEVERESRVKTGLWALPKERRTLEMMREHYGEEEGAIKGQIEGLEKERDALEEGGEIWAEVVETVMEVEEALRREMKSLQEETREVGMKRILERMKEALTKIEESLMAADEKGWNLLVAAIGAEAEALGEGYKILEGALHEAAGNDQGSEIPKDVAGRGQDGREAETGKHGLEELGNGVNPHVSGPISTKSEEDDDGPGPELLIEDHEDHEDN